MLRCIGGGLLAMATLGAHAQDPEDLLKRYRRAYHDENGVYLKMNTTITVKRTRDGVVATREVEEDHLTLGAASTRNDPERVNYSGMVPLTRIEAWTLSPDNGNYRKVPVTEFLHRDERNDQVFHDDARSVNFTFPRPAAGAITHVEYGISYPDARFASGHYFASNDPVEESTFTVVHDEDISVRAVPFHIADSALVRTTQHKHGRVEERFTMRRVPALVYESDAPQYPYFAPHVQLIITEHPPGPNNSELDQLYAWYYSHVAHINDAPDARLDSLSQALCTGANTPREKAARIFAWVQDHITYVAVEDGLNGYVPAPATQVCSARYGDCKGMANLLHALLLRAGLDSHLAWTGSRALPYTYDELPTSGTDDHMIDVVMIDGAPIFLDATSSHCPFGQPSFYIQDKQVLMSVDSTHYRVLRAPIVPAEENTATDSAIVHVEGNDLVGRSTLTFTGQMRAAMAQVFERVSQEKWKDILRLQYMKYNNRYVPDSVSLSGTDDHNAPLVVKYTFRIPGAVSGSGTERFVPLDLSSPWREKHYREDRTAPVQEDFSNVQRFITVLEPVPGATGAQPPKDAHFAHAHFGCDRTYQQLPGGRLLCSATFRTDRILMPTADLHDWNAMLAAREREMNRSVLVTVHP